MDYPKTKIEPVIEEKFGRKIIDDYRWLEKESEERTSWIETQNTFTRENINYPKGEVLRKAFEKYYRVSHQSIPIPSERYLFIYKREPNQEHGSLFCRDWPDETNERLIIDPNEYDPSGRTSIGGISSTLDGRYLSYHLHKDGSDFFMMRIIDVETLEVLDEIPRLVYTWANWLPDRTGFFYSRSETNDPEQISKVGMKVFFHKLGRDWREDEKVFGDQIPEDSIPGTRISRDGKHLIFNVSYGTYYTQLFYKNLDDTKSEVFQITDRPDAVFNTRFDEEYLFISTNMDAPKSRVFKCKLDGSIPYSDRWEEIVPEKEKSIVYMNALGGRLFIQYNQGLEFGNETFDFDGRYLGQMNQPALGNLMLPYGEPKVDAVFTYFTNRSTPLEHYRYNIEKNELKLYYRPNLDFDASEYITKLQFYRSCDGVEVPMVVTHHKDVIFDGNNKVILSAYGGFGSTMDHWFNKEWAVWLERGAIVVEAGIRGGAEYGEKWHENGMLDKKQNCFDDFIAAGEALIGERPIRDNDNGEYRTINYTKSEKLAITGGSNGGLLTGAVLVQRPDLWGVVVVRAPLLDMIRFHFTEGAKFWISEYGDPDKEADFAWLIDYSPYHNIKDNVDYPPTLIMTSLGDDRGVDPMHAMKMAAKLQRANRSDNPVLLKVNDKAGHGLAESIQQIIDHKVEVMAFIEKYIG